MDNSQDHDAQLLALGGSPAALIRNKDAIFNEFKRRLRAEVPAAQNEASPIIINTLPAFITRLGLALTSGNEITFASEYSNIALAHGNERAKLTSYSLREVVSEYQILREILVSFLRKDGLLTPEDWDVVHRSIDEAIGDATTAFVEVQQGFRDLFIAALSHDFRGPLSNAMNYIELIRRDAEPSQGQHFAGRAMYNLKQIDRMIKALLDVSRTNSGVGIALRVDRADAAAIAREVIGDLALRAGDRFVLDSETRLVGWWDADRLKQALNNLLENAVKYGKPGAPITCRVSQTQGRMFMSVHNEGDPIPEDQIPVLFKPFRRARSAERSDAGGWGLGLVMVQAIAEAHGGSVGVESSHSTGTVFTIDILCDAREKSDSAGTASAN